MVFALCLPKISLSGTGAITELVDRISQTASKKPLIVTEAALMKISLPETLLSQLRDHGIEPAVFDGVVANPTDHVVAQALRCYIDNHCDSIIGFGGGSSMDTAKVVRALIANPNKTVYELEGIGKIQKEGPMLSCVSTTSGTAAEVTSNAVITDTRRKVKMVIIDAAIIPDIAVNDPSLMVGLPSDVTAATGMDALTHAVEAYVSTGAHPLTDHSALAAITTISQALPEAVANGSDIVAREQMAHGQFLAGMAFNSAGLGLVHSLAHQPGATHNLPHGVCNAILLPVLCEFSRQEQPERFARIAKAMGVNTEQMSLEEASKAAITAIKDLSKQVGIPSGLAELGVVEKDIERWIAPALADPCGGTAPRPANADQVRELYHQAL
ncbi:iron-containing alcohol dehydrogenase [Celerinatantimonas sp. MCCC 1A17872]|uniref:iron-containing alcohol dehydrogenase n=1 Tax=Celerinatantimonas sp. MCCC 1A17872 TaxID=3177514 RepID=UPI0038C4284C